MKYSFHDFDIEEIHNRYFISSFVGQQTIFDKIRI